MTAKPKNFLNNKDLLIEIHKSKTTYCSFTDPEYHQYDTIVDYEEGKSLVNSLEYLMRDTTIATAKTKKAKRLGIKEDEVETEGLIFRVMTWDHIPKVQREPRRTSTQRTAPEIFEVDGDGDDFADLEAIAPVKNVDDLVHAKVNFPPFHHYRIEDGLPRLVGKSHWKGNINDGSFSKDNGQITKTLARMYILLCEKLGTRWNWRGYSYNDEMQSSAILQLTYVGLRFNEARSDNPFAYFTAVMNNSFTRILNTERRTQSIRDDIMELNGLAPSFSRQHAHELASKAVSN